MKVPILRYNNVLLTAFQEDLTDRDALNLQTDLMEMIERTQSQGVVIDVGSVAVIDSYLIRVIRETAGMAHLLGCEVVVSGIQPAVAMAMVELSSEDLPFRTVLDLQEGVDSLLNAAQRREEVPETKSAAPEEETAEPAAPPELA